MVPIIQLLNKIRWDKNENSADYEIGFLDKVLNKLVFVKYDEMIFEKGNKFSFSYRDKLGEIHEIPFHRIKQAKRKGVIIWKRER